MEGSSVYRLSENGIPSALVFQIESQYTWQPWIPYIKFLFCLLDGTGCSAAVFLSFVKGWFDICFEGKRNQQT
jgi:hypothetical protein